MHKLWNTKKLKKMKIRANNKWIISAGILLFFIGLSYLYFTPLFSGKELVQPDIVHYRGGAKELLDFRAENQTETYWSNSMFSGMPTYQIGAQFPGDLIKQVDYVLNFLPRPANYLFLLLAGFYLLGMVTLRNWKLSLLGATFFAFSTYFFIIIAAGHNSKVHTIAYFAPLLAGVILIFVRQKYWWGFLTLTLSTALQLSSNHPQMTYYLFLAVGIFVLTELYHTFKTKGPWRHILISVALLLGAIGFGLGMNAQRILTNAQYVQETTRGKHVLENSSEKAKSGLSRESITMWSYGKLETLNIFIPRLMGGGSSEPEGEVMMSEIQDLVQSNVSSQEEMDQISRGFGSLTYWGDQPGTSGPAYQGAVVVFLAILGFFVATFRHRIWILAATILTILLAWGHNFSVLTDFFIDYLPFYNKFRAPSSILVVVELLFPLIAILGLYRLLFLKDMVVAEKKKRLLLATSFAVSLVLILLLGGKSLLGFATETEKQYLPDYLLDYLTTERSQMFQADAIKTLLMVLVTAAILYLNLKRKVPLNIAMILIGAISLLDLWSVNKRYLNESNFSDSAFSQNPFLTESSPYLTEKSQENPYIQGLISQIPVNKALEEINEKDSSQYRVYNQTLGTFSETNTSYFHSSVGGYSAAKLRRYDDVINRYFNTMDTVAVPKILNILNAKYFVFGSATEPQLMQNAGANGNAWFVSKVHTVRSAEQELESLGTIDSKTEAAVHQDQMAYLQGKTLTLDSTATLNLETYLPNHIVFSARTKTPQLAVFSEIYYPHGWQFTLNGRKVPHLRVNYMLRGLYIPAGTHRVEMVFEPTVLETGKWISMLTFFGFLLVMIAAWILQRRKLGFNSTKL